MSACSSCGSAVPGGARFCPSCGAPVEESRPAADERKIATLLFADLVGSTALGEGDDPERVRALLDRFYDAMAEEIEHAGGTLEKFAGDAVMAAFGAPAAQEDHAERALHAALGLQRRMQALFGDALKLRVGVNTGEVVVGRAREGSSFVTGDAVNVAARLEQAAAPGEVLVGERTVHAVRGAFEFGDPRRVEAKGKADSVPCRPLQRALTLMRPRGVGGLARSFVGRERELELLEATYRRVVDTGKPHVVTIVGDAGVGKSRLVRELWAWLAEQRPQPLQRTGRCLSYGQGITYWPLAEVLREQLGLLDSDAPDTVLERLGDRDVLALTLGIAPDGELHPLVARERLHEAWVELLSGLASERPLVLLVEDLHWAEDELVELLERMLRDVHAPLYLLATARPELVTSRPSWGGARRNASAVWLDPLSAEGTAQLVDELLSARMPRRVREALVARAEGNPFFVEELVGTLIDRGLLLRRGGRWAVDSLPDDLVVPDSVRAVVAARIDLLPPREKAALQASAVAGRVFWEGAVRAMVDDEPDFGLLEDRDFVRRRPGSSVVGEREYALKHALTREVAYASVPRARRARLHARFAEWLERSTEGRNEHAAFVGHHYAAAVAPEDRDLAWRGDDGTYERLLAKAVHWLERAAEGAVRRYELDDAIALLSRALELQDDRAAKARLLHALGRAHALRFDGEAFWAAMEQAVELTDDDALRADVYADLALQTASRAGMWRRAPDDEVVEGWAGRALALALRDSEAGVKARLARIFWRVSDERGDLAEATAVAERLGDAQLRSHVRIAHSFAAFDRGEYADAAGWAERAFELEPEASDPDLVADMYGAAVLPAMARGRLGEARRLAAGHDAITSRLTAHHRVHAVAVLLELEELAADWDAIRALEQRTVAAVDANLDTPCIRNARSLLVEAVAAEAAGDAARARELEHRARDVELAGYGHALGAPRLRLALLRRDLAGAERLARDRPATSRQSWFRLAALATRLDALAALGDRRAVEEEAPPLLRPETLLEPFALRALGVVREDEALVRRALERFTAMGLGWHAEQTRALLRI